MLTEKDIIILNHLRENARQSLAKISTKTNIPTSTLFDRLNRLENEIINKHISLIDFSKLGYGLIVNFAVKAEEKGKMKDFLLEHKNINSLYKILPEFDFYAECIFKDMQEWELFKEELEDVGMKKFEESFIVDEIKKEGFFL